MLSADISQGNHAATEEKEVLPPAQENRSMIFLTGENSPRSAPDLLYGGRAREKNQHDKGEFDFLPAPFGALRYNRLGIDPRASLSAGNQGEVLRMVQSSNYFPGNGHHTPGHAPVAQPGKRRTGRLYFCTSTGS